MNIIPAPVEAAVSSKKPTGYDLKSEVMVYGQSMGLPADGQSIPPAAVQPGLAEPSNLKEALDAAEAWNFDSKTDAVGAMEDLRLFMRDELGAIIPPLELAVVQIHRVNASLAALKNEFTLEDISDNVTDYVAGIERLIRKYG